MMPMPPIKTFLVTFGLFCFALGALAALALS